MIIIAVLVLLGSIGMSFFLLFSSYQNIQLFREAANNFKRGDSKSCDSAERQLLQLINNDDDNEQAFIMLGEIARARKVYSEEMYYTYQAHKLNPLSSENKMKYINSLLMNREFKRLESFLNQQNSLSAELQPFLLYAAIKNETLSKYLRNFSEKYDSNIYRLAEIIKSKADSKDKIKSLLELDKKVVGDSDFMRQELAINLAENYLNNGDVDNAEKFLLEAYKINECVFAAPLAKFYANYRSFGSAIAIYEKYLSVYHDIEVALQCAELYCLTQNQAKIVELSKEYQNDSGEAAILSCYYFDVLTGFANNDLKSIKSYVTPLQDVIDTPLATFIYLCVEVEEKNLSGILRHYNAMVKQPPYLNFQEQADRLVADVLKSFIASKKADSELFYQLAENLCNRYNDVVIGKYLILSQRGKGKFNSGLLAQLLKNYPEDSGVIKIAIEYYLDRDLATADKLIDSYLKLFPKEKHDICRYEIISAMRKHDYERVSLLFKENFSRDILPEYWSFAVNLKRVDDLKKIAEDSTYKDFADAALLLIEGKKEAALDILAATDETEELNLRFFAAKTLGENNRIHEALKQYQKFPEKSVFRIAVLLNSSELYAVEGELNESLRLAHLAYSLAPDMEETQLCYGDKLLKNGKLAEIADVVRISKNSSYRKELIKLYIRSMEYRIQKSDLEKNPEKISGMCEQILRLDADNALALQFKQKILEARKRQ